MVIFCHVVCICAKDIEWYKHELFAGLYDEDVSYILTKVTSLKHYKVN